MKNVAAAVVALAPLMGSSGATEQVSFDKVNDYIRMCDRPLAEGMSEACAVYLEMATQGSMMALLHEFNAEKDGLDPNSISRRMLRRYSTPFSCPDGGDASYGEVQQVMIKRIQARGYSEEDLALPRMMEALSEAPICKGTTK